MQTVKYLVDLARGEYCQAIRSDALAGDGTAVLGEGVTLLPQAVARWHGKMEGFKGRVRLAAERADEQHGWIHVQ
jgi:hypothetical protein